MKKFTKFIALTTAMTMLFGVVVYAGPSQTTTSNSSESKSAKTTTSAPSTTNTVATVAQDAKAPAPAYAAGVTASEGVAVAPVNAATVNYATLGAKLLVSPTAVVYKSVVLTGDAKNVTLNVAGLAIPVPPAKAKKLIDGGYDGKVVTFGIRPEDVYDSEMFIETSPQSVFESTVKVYELLGAEVYLYFDLEEFPITARVDPRTTARPGDTVKFAFDVEKIHVFDKDTECVITN